jgi:hypothetical protein
VRNLGQGALGRAHDVDPRADGASANVHLSRGASFAKQRWATQQGDAW